MDIKASMADDDFDDAQQPANDDDDSSSSDYDDDGQPANDDDASFEPNPSTTKMPADFSTPAPKTPLKSMPSEFTADDSAYVDVSKYQNKGVMKNILREGSGDNDDDDGGKPSTNYSVEVHYIGRLLDGTQFDSSRQRGETFKFALGKSEVIQAWDQGVASMKRGELCELVCAPELAYGESGSPPSIPPNAVLKFEVELLDFRGEDVTADKDGGITRILLTKGSGFKTPAEGNRVKIHLVRRSRDGLEALEERDEEFYVGDCESFYLPCGIDLAVQKMKVNEKSRFTLAPDYAFGAEGNVELGIRGDEPIVYELTLEHLDAFKESYELRLCQEKIDEALRLKALGTDFLKRGNLKMAAIYYKQAVKLIDDNHNFEVQEYDSPETKEEKEAAVEQRRDALKTCKLNLALVHIKELEFGEAYTQCEAVLALDSDNVKALYRLGLACVGRQDWMDAKKWFKRALEVDGSCADAKRQLTLVDSKMHAQKKADRQLYKKMFGDIKFGVRKATPPPSEAENGGGEAGGGDASSSDVEQQNGDADTKPAADVELQAGGDSPPPLEA